MKLAKLRKRKLILLCIGILLIPVFIVAILLFIYHQGLNSKMDEVLSEIRASDYPISAKELDGFYPSISTDKNAAIIYGNGFKLYVKPEAPEMVIFAGDAPLPVLGVKLPKNIRKASQDYLEANQPCLDLCDKAVILTHSRYPIDLSVGLFDTQLPHLRKIRKIVKLYQIKAFIDIEDGEYENAISNIDKALNLSYSLDKEPILISSLVLNACYYEVMDLVVRLINTRQLNAKELKLLRSVIFQQDISLPLKHVLIGEQASAIDLIQSDRSLVEIIDIYISLGGGNVKKRSWGYNRFLDLNNILYSISGWRKKDLIYFCENFPQLIDMSENTYPENKSKLKLFFRDLDSKKNKETLIISGMVMSAFEICFKINYSQKAHSRIIGTMLNIETYRFKHGRLPKNLPVIKNDVSTNDPFDGNGLRFIQEKKGYCIYSVGPDGRDNNGDGDDISVHILR